MAKNMDTEAIMEIARATARADRDRAAERARHPGSEPREGFRILCQLDRIEARLKSLDSAEDIRRDLAQRVCPTPDYH